MGIAERGFLVSVMSATQTLHINWLWEHLYFFKLGMTKRNILTNLISYPTKIYASGKSEPKYPIQPFWNWTQPKQSQIHIGWGLSIKKKIGSVSAKEQLVYIPQFPKKMISTGEGFSHFCAGAWQVAQCGWTSAQAPPAVLVHLTTTAGGLQAAATRPVHSPESGRQQLLLTKSFHNSVLWWPEPARPRHRGPIRAL